VSSTSASPALRPIRDPNASEASVQVLRAVGPDQRVAIGFATANARLPDRQPFVEQISNSR
jgi:hypothetical protein